MENFGDRRILAIDDFDQRVAVPFRREQAAELAALLTEEFPDEPGTRKAVQERLALDDQITDVGPAKSYGFGPGGQTQIGFAYRGVRCAVSLEDRFDTVLTWFIHDLDAEGVPRRSMQFRSLDRLQGYVDGRFGIYDL